MEYGPLGIYEIGERSSWMDGWEVLGAVVVMVGVIYLGLATCEDVLS